MSVPGFSVALGSSRNEVVRSATEGGRDAHEIDGASSAQPLGSGHVREASGGTKPWARGPVRMCDTATMASYRRYTPDTVGVTQQDKGILQFTVTGTLIIASKR
ncbi:hypothetical protein GCM10011583_15870 [Streptomyces camponoticapitis]|uniref:Uncharacterized protein n=1 Tax=Streptomyces camponoticapitis TaxID=1616125 RepID=A0ABQ2E0M1_9ACTN|nr:hypothetical protein GCM10011583_15870 [Streptomyces camponoticapitis]